MRWEVRQIGQSRFLVTGQRRPLPAERLRRGAAAAWLASSLLYLGCEAVAASAFPDYSYAHRYISDLGSPDRGFFLGRMLDSPLHAVMNAGFIGRGLLFLAGSMLILRSGPIPGRAAFMILSLVQAAGIILVGMVPVGPSSGALLPLHTFGAAMAILGGNLFWVCVGLSGRRAGLSRDYRAASLAMGGAGLLGFALLAANLALAAPLLFEDGVWERLSVYTVIGWTGFSGLALWLGAWPKRALPG
jgi:hypothetical membrane protein